MKILVTGGAGFIGSNLVDEFIRLGHHVVCFDNLSTGKKENIRSHFKNPKFTFIEGDIRDLEACKTAVQNCEYVCHQAALGSVPRSIGDPVTTNDVNISGFLNVLIASRDQGIKRFVYAASSSTYGDSKALPKIEHTIGNPLSPYAITKYVNELYANVISNAFRMQCIGLRYFNVFGKRQDPEGPYAAVIPLWVKKMISHESPVINGDSSYSRDFTYIENVIQANVKALFSSSEQIFEGRKKYYKIDSEKNMLPAHPNYKEIQLNVSGTHFSEIFNVAFGKSTSLHELFKALRLYLSAYDPEIAEISETIGDFRIGDIPHSQASIIKAETILGYKPHFSAAEGFEIAAEWYYQYFNENRSVTI